MRKINKIILSSLCCLLLIAGNTAAQDIIEVGSIHQGEVDAKAFNLLSDGSVKVTGYNAEFRDDGEVLFYGWIIDSKTRELVWHSLEDTFDDYEDNGISSFEETVKPKRVKSPILLKLIFSI